MVNNKTSIKLLQFIYDDSLSGWNKQRIVTDKVLQQKKAAFTELLLVQ